MRNLEWGGHEVELRLVGGVSCARGHDGVWLATGRRNEEVGPNLPWLTSVLGQLAHGCLRSRLTSASGATADEVDALLERLRRGGWLSVTPHLGERALYTLRPVGPELGPTREDVESRLRLSRFTVLRRDRDGLVAESPLANARLETLDVGVQAALGVLAGGASDLATLSRLSDLGVEAVTVDALLRDLRRAGLMEAPDGGEHSDLTLSQWTPHELWFHRQSRMTDRSDREEAYGRTQWARGLHTPLPGRRPPYPGPEIPLPAADLTRIRRDDPPLAAVVEDRRSVRHHDDDHPITVDQLGEFLYRCARVRTTREVDGVEYPNRPHPSGGSAYELEIYPVVRRVSGLPSGMYHYDSHSHGLRTVSPGGPPVRRLLRAALRAAPAAEPPQVLLVLTARFGRLAWTYEQMPYSLVLKHVGVLYQSMYLAATAMGLAACGLGGGDATDFNAATGVDYAAESAVGEFSLGSRRPDE
ncbi:SagB family peptide dehydrogenase [Spiractinospora alimapuensis]|uniref:SagB family peptide dehydrogenase n=1 Tax=Spiractinospora alimapuensis TaxID=2820884 RepID=UPI001F1AA478|nr:SagB family peptide dehydrogenase [Spiractinospora alimapuensis]QVQ51269.1 SagB family peptide dehydrogenase [Spiractinospora alimapuensis]